MPPIAEAFVEVVPNTDRFAPLLTRQLRTVLNTMTVPKIAVAPDTRRFTTELNRGLRTAIREAQAIKVPVSPDTRRFKIELNQQLRTALADVKAPAIKVSTANTQEFVRDVRTKLQTQLGNLKAPAIKISSASVSRAFITDLEQKLREAVGKAKVPTVTVPVQPVVKPPTTAPPRQPRGGAAGTADTLEEAREGAAAHQAALARERQNEAARRGRAALRGIETIQRQLNEVETAGLTATTKLEAARHRAQAAGKAYATSVRVLRDAEISGKEATFQSAVALEQKARQLKKDTDEEYKNAKAVETRRQRVAQASRGAGSAALTFLGLRGATLAATGAFLAGAAAINAIGAAIGNAVKFEVQLAVLRETAGATADELERAGNVARTLGTDVSLPAVTAGDAAQAITELAKAGLSLQDAMAGARGVLQLATAAQIDNSQATELAASALNAFNLSGDQATHVADLFTNAANAAQGSIVDMGVAFQQSAAVVNQAGISLEDANALLTLLAKNGLRGSDAGTSLRTALLRLINPTEEASSIIEQLGLRIRDAQGNIRPDIFAQFGEATRNLSPAIRDMEAAILFGQDAIRAANILAAEGAAGLEDARTAMERQGSAAALAAARTEGLAGQVEALRSQLETFGATVGAIAIPALTGLVSNINSLVTVLQKATEGAISLTGALPGGGAFADVLGFAASTFTGGGLLLRGAGFAAEHFRSEQEKTTDALNKSLAAANKLRAELVAMGAAESEIAAVDAQIKQLSEDLQAAQVGVIRTDVTGTDQIENALNAANRLRESLEARNIPTTGIDNLIETLEGKLAAAATTTRDHFEAIGKAGQFEQLDAGVRNLDARMSGLRNTAEQLFRQLERGPAAPAPAAEPEIFDPESIRTAFTARSERVTTLAKNLRADLQQLRGLDPTSDLARSIRADVATIVAEMERIPGAFNAVISQAAQLAPVLGDQLRASLEEVTGVELERDIGIDRVIREQISDIRALGPEGAEELESIGRQLIAGLGKGIRDNNDAVQAAREKLQEVIEQGQEALRRSVQTARGNLESFGDQLAQSVGQIFEKMQFTTDPLQRRVIKLGLDQELRTAQRALEEARTQGLRGDALQPFIENVDSAKDAIKTFSKSGKTDLETLQKALERLQKQQERRQLVRGVRDAREQLADLRASIAGVSEVAPGGETVVARMLREAEEGVQDAKGELQTFDLQDQIDQFEDMRDAAKEVAEEGIKRIVDQFNRGQISLRRFKQLLDGQLKPALEALPDENLGLTFTREFRRQVRNLVDQAEAVARFLGLPGTEPGRNIEEPAKQEAINAKNRFDAAKRLQEAIRDANISTEKNTRNTVAALLVIAREVRKRPLTKAEVKAIRSGDIKATTALVTAK